MHALNFGACETYSASRKDCRQSACNALTAVRHRNVPVFVKKMHTQNVYASFFGNIVQ